MSNYAYDDVEPGADRLLVVAKERIAELERKLFEKDQRVAGLLAKLETLRCPNGLCMDGQILSGDHESGDSFYNCDQCWHGRWLSASSMYGELHAKFVAKERENAALLQQVDAMDNSLRAVLGAIDAGLLVRDISRDHEPGWAMQQLPLVLTLKGAHAALQLAGRNETVPSEGKENDRG